MNLLLDTHVALWWLDDSPSLSKKGRTLIADTDNLIVLSAVVIWEIRIKQALGKLEIPSNFYTVIKQQGFEMLPISPDHAYAVGDLPMVHRDPFDRMLLAQAKLENLSIVTHDTTFQRYGISVLEV